MAEKIAAIVLFFVANPGPATGAIQAPTHGVRCSETAPTKGLLSISGTSTEGGASGVFQKAVDLRTGFSQSTRTTGAMRMSSGFDGVAWEAENGIVISLDLPGLVEDARTQAVVDRFGWLNRAVASPTPLRSGLGSIATRISTPRGSPAIAHWDKETGRPIDVVIDSDAGRVTTTFGDWRCIAGLLYPFRQIKSDATGAVTELQIETARLSSRFSTRATQRPAPQTKGELGSAESRQVAFQFASSRDAHIVVHASVNGQDARLLFDTGAANYFSPRSAERLSLKVSGGLNLGGPGPGSVNGGFSLVQSISIGGASLRDQAVMVGPVPWPDTPGKGAELDGLAGFEFLAEFRTKIDYGKQSLVFTSFDAPRIDHGARLPFRSDGHNMYVMASVNGHPGLFRVDTGDAAAITVFKHFANHSGIILNRTSAESAGVGLGGKFSISRTNVPSFSIAREKLVNVPVDVSQSDVGLFSSRTIAGSIGSEFLHCFNLTFDFRARTVSFERRAQTQNCLAQPLSRTVGGIPIRVRIG